MPFRPFQNPWSSTALAPQPHRHLQRRQTLWADPKRASSAAAKSIMAQILKKIPSCSALRIDKLSLIALEAVLELYLKKDYSSLPLWAMANLPAEKQ
jgi:hypothetical protein